MRLAAAPPSRARAGAPGARLALSSRARAARVSAERSQRSPSPAALGPVAAALSPDCGREEGAPCPRAPSPPPSCMPTFWVRPGFAISSPPRALRICSVDALGYDPRTSFNWTSELWRCRVSRAFLGGVFWGHLAQFSSRGVPDSPNWSANSLTFLWEKLNWLRGVWRTKFPPLAL